MAKPIAPALWALSHCLSLNKWIHHQSNCFERARNSFILSRTGARSGGGGYGLLAGDGTEFQFLLLTSNKPNLFSVTQCLYLQKKEKGPFGQPLPLAHEDIMRIHEVIFVTELWVPIEVLGKYGGLSIKKSPPVLLLVRAWPPC